MSLSFVLSLAFIAGLIAGAGATALLVRIHRLEQRIHQLEQSSAKRLPYKSADEIENGIAALLYTIQDTNLRNDMLQNVLAHLQKARNPEGKK
jgi:flagellar biosynthesis/type III secretory pathway chaperone